MTPERAYPLNAWYPAAWSREIGPTLFARKICNTDIVLYRTRDGGVAALEDACWHRLLPLSLGRLVNDQVICGYHGLVFNAAGRCTFMPAQKTINPSACVRAYPVAERHRLVWIWPGDPALADPAEVPDFHWNDGTDWKGEGGTFVSLQCDYQLVVDNLMDLTHETYVHAGSIGDDAILESPFEVMHDDRSATLSRWMINIEPPPFWTKQLGRPGRVDRWQIITFEAPNVVIGDVGVALTGTGAPQGDRSQGVNGAFLCALAPETATSCHYFWNFVRTFRTDDKALTRSLQLAHVNEGKGVYDQDHAVLEAQQRAILANPRRPFYNLNIDAGALWARRLIEHRIQRERAAPLAAE
jgi:phenylpropionate dioxygenase-like ring-hydroxylating dioxygenase large terminal subunit